MPEPTADPWRLAEWRTLPGECFIAGCSASEVDERGPVFLRGGSMHKACPEHWEAIMRVLGEETAWQLDAMRSEPADA